MCIFLRCLIDLLKCSGGMLLSSCYLTTQRIIAVNHAWWINSDCCWSLEGLYIISLGHSFFFSWQVLQTASVEDRGKYTLNTSRPSPNVRDGSSSLYPVYHTVSERWIHWVRWILSEQQPSLYINSKIINVAVSFGSLVSNLFNLSLMFCMWVLLCQC